MAHEQWALGVSTYIIRSEKLLSTQPQRFWKKEGGGTRSNMGGIICPLCLRYRVTPLASLLPTSLKGCQETNFFSKLMRPRYIFEFNSYKQGWVINICQFESIFSVMSNPCLTPEEFLTKALLLQMSFSVWKKNSGIDHWGKITSVKINLLGPAFQAFNHASC